MTGPGCHFAPQAVPPVNLFRTRSSSLPLSFLLSLVFTSSLLAHPAALQASPLTSTSAPSSSSSASTSGSSSAWQTSSWHPHTANFGRRHRRALGATPPKCTASCPDRSVCASMSGAPVCKCPSGARLINNKCSSDALANSEYLDPHNEARAAVGSVPLVWSQSLAQRAQAWVTKLTTSATYKCALKHSYAAGFGENIAAYFGTPTAGSATSAINLLVAEGSAYKYTRFNKSGGCCWHYTQVIWNNTRNVGCAVAQCKFKPGRMWVCSYSPPGNVDGQFPYYRDPCYGVVCPSTSTCSNSTGKPVCKCPPGQVLVNQKCIENPCNTVDCAGNLICDGSSGEAKCVCPPGRVLSAPNHCDYLRCVNVSCPATARCSVTGSVQQPFCVCPYNTSMVNRTCTSAASSSVQSTSITLYNTANFTNSPSSLPPAIFRAPLPGKCVKVPTSFAGRIGSYMITFDVKDGAAGALSPGSRTVMCKSVFFWSSQWCNGQAMGWTYQGAWANTISNAKATGQFQQAYGISCK